MKRPVSEIIIVRSRQTAVNNKQGNTFLHWRAAKCKQGKASRKKKCVRHDRRRVKAQKIINFRIPKKKKKFSDERLSRVCVVQQMGGGER